MGDLYYGSARTRIHMSDRTLMHLSAVVTAKLRRNEPFLLTWLDADAIGDGRSSVWVHQTCDLHYKYEESEHIDLDRALLERMSRSASSSQGLHVDDATMLEPAEDAATA
jgi:hypothetical protein